MEQYLLARLHPLIVIQDILLQEVLCVHVKPVEHGVAVKQLVKVPVHYSYRYLAEGGGGGGVFSYLSWNYLPV